MTKEELQKLMAGIFVEHQIKVCADRFAAWWTLCESVPTETARKAYPLLLRKNTYGVPKVAHFMECVKEVQDAENPEKQITDGEAWGAVMKCVGKWGYYNERNAIADLHAMDPKISQTVQSFGWRTICEGDASQNNTLRAQFLKAWHSLRNRQELFESLGIQVGMGLDTLSEGIKPLPLDLERKFKAIGIYKDKTEQ